MSSRADRLSPSGYATLRQCPAKWYDTYVLGLGDEPDTEATIRGTFVHRVAERLMDLEPHKRTLEMAQAIATHIWTSEDGLAIWGGLGPEASAICTPDGNTEDEIREFKWKAWQSIVHLFELLEPAKVDVWDTEFPLDLELGGVPVVGSIDLVRNGPLGLKPVDYKTGEAPELDTPWAEERKTEKLEQLLMYAAALRALGHPVSSVSLLFLSPTGRTGWLDKRIDDATLDQFTERLQAAWERTRAIQAAAVRPEPYTGPLCGWCGCIERCPEGQREVRIRISRGRNAGPAAERLGL